MTPASSVQRSAAVLLAASLASTIGGLPFNALPVMLGSLADSFGLQAQAVGLMGSICFAGYLAGTLAAPFWIGRANWRWLTLVSAVATIAALALSSQVSDVNTLYGIWALIGFFASTMTCLGLRVLSDLPDKERAFGIRQGVELTVTAAVLFALPPLLIAPYKYPGAALALAAVVAVLAVSAFWLPARAVTATQTEQPEHPASTGLPRESIIRLAVFFVFLVGNIALWAFLERIGASLRIAPAEMGTVFAVLKLLGGAAAFTVAAIGRRAGQRWPHAVVWAGVMAGVALLASARGFVPYAAGAWVWEFAFTCGCVFQAAAIARSDPGGKAVMLVPAVFGFSSMVGPGLGGALISGSQYGPVLALAAGCALLPALAYSLRAARVSS